MFIRSIAKFLDSLSNLEITVHIYGHFKIKTSADVEKRKVLQ